MPPKPATACRKPGCPGRVRDGVCSVCGPLHTRRSERKAETDLQRGTARERGYDARWERVRKMQLRRHPLCERCLLKGRVTPAVLVHHILPLRSGGALLDEDNLQCLCRKCHGIVHAELDAAKQRAQEEGGRGGGYG